MALGVHTNYKYMKSVFRDLWIWMWIWMGNFISTASLQTDNDMQSHNRALRSIVR